MYLCILHLHHNTTCIFHLCVCARNQNGKMIRGSLFKRRVELLGFSPVPFIFLRWSGIKSLSSFPPQTLVYEKPGFEGSCLEIDADVFSFCESEAGFSAAGANADSKNLKSVGSLKVIGGLWVFFFFSFFTSFSPLTRSLTAVVARGQVGSVCLDFLELV